MFRTMKLCFFPSMHCLDSVEEKMQGRVCVNHCIRKHTLLHKKLLISLLKSILHHPHHRKQKYIVYVISYIIMYMHLMYRIVTNFLRVIYYDQEQDFQR